MHFILLLSPAYRDSYSAVSRQTIKVKPLRGEQKRVPFEQIVIYHRFDVMSLGISAVRLVRFCSNKLKFIRVTVTIFVRS